MNTRFGYIFLNCLFWRCFCPQNNVLLTRDSMRFFCRASAYFFTPEIRAFWAAGLRKRFVTLAPR